MKLNLTKPLAVFDIEATGVNVASDRIVEISILKVNTDNSTEIKTFRINPQILIPEIVSKIHGIYDKDVVDCPSFKEVAGQLLKFCNGAIVGTSIKKNGIVNLGKIKELIQVVKKYD